MSNFFTRLFSRFSSDTQTENAPEVLTLSRKHLPFIRPGMYWFTDDTFSDKIQEGKDVRAIVLSKDGRDVVALLLDEQNVAYEREGDYRVYAYQTLIDDRIMTVDKCVPELDILQAAHYHINLLNKRLKEAGLPEIHGVYWSWDNGRPHFMYDIERGERQLIRNGDCAKLRFVLQLYVRG